LEYAAFSTLRFLKLSGIGDAGVMAILCFDLNNNDEANFTVFENGFSLFSRDFDLAGEAAGFEQTVESDLLQKQDKLKNEIRLSFDYYNRKFPDKEVRNVFVISDKESQEGLKPFFAESSIPVKFVDTQKALGKTATYSSILVKSFAASLFKSTPLKMKINLVGSRLKAARAAEAANNPFALLEDIKVDFKYIFFGVCICIAVFSYGLMRKQAMQQELDLIKNKRMKISSVVASDDFQALSAASSKFKKRITALDSVVRNQVYATPLFSAIPRSLPKGVWLESFSFKHGKDVPSELVLNGQAYLRDSDQEFEAVNIFITNLKKDPVFSGYFKEIAMGFIDRSDVSGRNVAVFKITCKNFAEKK